MNQYKEYIFGVLSERELLEQLAEEAAELSQAALKLIRAEGLSNNTTPISAGQARTNLQEEFSDILMVAELLELIDCQNAKKWRRWAERLGYEHENKKGDELKAKAVEMIEIECHKHQHCDKECPFFDNDKVDCKFATRPYEWSDGKDEE